MCWGEQINAQRWPTLLIKFFVLLVWDCQIPSQWFSVQARCVKPTYYGPPPLSVQSLENSSIPQGQPSRPHQIASAMFWEPKPSIPPLAGPMHAMLSGNITLSVQTPKTEVTEQDM